MDQPLGEPLPASADEADGDSFELVERQLQRLSELVDKFESVVFEPLETDESEIRGFLDRLFPDEASQKQLEDLRKRIADDSASLMSEDAPFTEASLTSCIRGLLTEDILSDEKQAILRDFLESDVAKSEIADVLNMRYSDLKQWHWDAGKDGIRVMPRRGLNGKYRVWADDDILQMIFVQYIGIRLCNLLKPALTTFMTFVCSRDELPSAADLDRRRFYLNQPITSSPTIEGRRRSDYFDKFFLSQLPTTETSLFDGGNSYDDDDNITVDSDYEDATTSPQKRSGIKQQLLRHLTAEVMVHRLRNVTYETRTGPRSGVALVQTDMQWYATGLPHSTIFAVMRYIGFGQDWVDFFKKYLEAPLNLDAASDDRPQLGPRTRKRGVPMAHASEKFTGELVLFFMDLAVNRETGILLYRLHDDIWLVGEPERSARAWSCMQSFAKVFGLDFNKAKTGSVYLPGSAKRDATIATTLPAGPVKIGFLCLDPETGKWVIDQKLVGAHVDQLKRQLADCKSVLSWVQTWNSCIGRFFSHTFGEPARCFGREHVDEVLNTYQNMLRRLFPGADGKEGSVVEHGKLQTLSSTSSCFPCTNPTNHTTPNSQAHDPGPLRSLGPARSLRLPAGAAGRPGAAEPFRRPLPGPQQHHRNPRGDHRRVSQVRARAVPRGQKRLRAIQRISPAPPAPPQVPRRRVPQEGAHLGGGPDDLLLARRVLPVPRAADPRLLRRL
jgi:hypothetical protein